MPPFPRSAAQPLSYDDLIDLHFMLMNDELFMALLRDSLLGAGQRG